MKPNTVAVIAILASALTGCATFIPNKTFRLSIETIPSGAEIVQNGEVLCVAPCALNYPLTDDQIGLGGMTIQPLTARWTVGPERVYRDTFRWTPTVSKAHASVVIQQPARPETYALGWELCATDNDGGRHCSPVPDVVVGDCQEIVRRINDGEGWKSRLHELDDAERAAYGFDDVCTALLLREGVITRPPVDPVAAMMFLCAPIGGSSPCFGP